MTFNPNIPQSGDIPSQSQAQLLTNFTQLNTVFGEDHISFNDATSANRGKHDKSTYVEQVSGPSTSSNEVAVYSKEVSTVSRLFLREEGNGSERQFSGPVSIASTGYTTILGGAILQWGSSTQSDGGAVTFPVAFPTACFQVFVTVYNNNAATVANDFVGVRPASTSTTQFVVTASRRVTVAASPVTFSWFAIGN